MGIMVTKDESDKRTEGIREERKRIARSGRSDAAQEMQAREMEISRRLVNRDHKGRVGMLKGYGYKITKVDDEAQLVTGEEVEGAQTHGDLILMETPIANYERRRKSRMDRADQLAGNHAESARENINKLARDSGLVGPHKEAVFDESRES